MPFDDRGLSALTTANGFTLWHYRTADERAAVLAPGYFDPAAARLQPGDIVIVQASDATAMLPIRVGATAGTGLTIDSLGSGLRFVRSSTQRFAFGMSAILAVRGIALSPLPETLMPGDMIQVTATATGPIFRIVFSLRNTAGLDVQAPQTVSILGGIASFAFIAPAPGGGYRIHAEDAEDPATAAVTPPFAVSQPPRLRNEGGGLLLQENGMALLL